MMCANWYRIGLVKILVPQNFMVFYFLFFVSKSLCFLLLTYIYLLFMFSPFDTSEGSFEELVMCRIFKKTNRKIIIREIK